MPKKNFSTHFKILWAAMSTNSSNLNSVSVAKPYCSILQSETRHVKMQTEISVGKIKFNHEIDLNKISMMNFCIDLIIKFLSRVVNLSEDFFLNKCSSVKHVKSNRQLKSCDWKVKWLAVNINKTFDQNCSICQPTQTFGSLIIESFEMTFKYLSCFLWMKRFLIYQNSCTKLASNKFKKKSKITRRQTVCEKL